MSESFTFDVVSFRSGTLRVDLELIVFIGILDHVRADRAAAGTDAYLCEKWAA